MINEARTISQFRLALKAIRANRLAYTSLWIIALLYLLAIFADFISPYSYDNENRLFSYAPGTRIHIIDSQGKLRLPFVYGIESYFSQYKRRIYQEDRDNIFALRLFIRGDKYKLLGFIPSDLHLFGVEQPGRIYLWGADSRGRDIFSRILYGSRVSLSIGLIAVMISFTLGLLIGGFAGYYGGIIDNIIMRICEMMMMIPTFYLMLALRAAVPSTLGSLEVYILIVVIFSFISWPGLARIIRGMALSLRERDYCLAAKAVGLSDFYIIRKHILPHTFSYTIVAITLSIPGYILGESALSLLGLGIQDPFASWGNMLTDAMNIAHIKFHPWVLLPGLFIFITVMSFNLVGEALRDVFDPMVKQKV